MKKSMLKTVMAAVAVGLGLTAFAADEPEVVKLNDGSTVTWSHFVGVHNGTVTVGSIPENDPLRTAVTNATTAKNNAETEVSTKEGNLTAAQNTLAALTQAKIDELQGNINTAKSTLSGLQSDSTNLEDQIEEQNKIITDNQELIKTAQAAIDKAAADSTTTFNALKALPKITKNQPFPWLVTMDNLASQFLNNLNNGIDSPSIWIKLASSKTFNVTKTTLTFSFTTASPNADDTNWVQVTPSEYMDKIFGDDAPATVNTVIVYMGKDYAELPINNNQTDLTVSTYQGNKDYALSLAYNAVNTLTHSSSYSTQVVTDKYQDEEQANAYKTQLEGFRKTIAEQKKLINGWHQSSEGWKEGDTEVDGYNDLINKAKEKLDGEKGLNSQLKTLKETTIPGAEAAVEAAEAAYKEQVTDVQNAVPAAEQELQDAKDALTKAQSDLAAAEKALADAEKTANANAIAANYNNVELNGDVNAEVATGASSVITSFSGTITGNNKVINVTGGNLFGTLTATAEIEKVAINGNLAGKNNGKCYNVAIWDGATGEWYNNKNVETTYASLGALGNAARATFGVDFANKKLTDLTTATKVYDLTVYEINKAAMQMYATISSDDKGYYFNYVTDKGVNTSYLFPANTFAKCGTVDITTDFANLPNIFYGANNTCDNVVITDQVNFYCPVEIAAANVTYNRSFSKGFNSLCLPFALTPAKVNNNELLTFDGEADGRFWFTTASTVAAGTPMILKAAEEFNNIVVTDVTISPIVDARKLLAGRGGQIGGGSLVPGFSCAVFQYSDVTEIIGSAESSRVFGLKGSEFQVAGENAKFKAFRMAIVSSYKSNPMPRKIGIRDEFGNDITEEETDGIANVEAEATSLGVTTAQGQIIFTSEADYGTVQVYGIDGRVAANATVMAGTTAIDVPAGMYIVLGKKVLVK